MKKKLRVVVVVSNTIGPVSFLSSPLMWRNLVNPQLAATTLVRQWLMISGCCMSLVSFLMDDMCIDFICGPKLSCRSIYDAQIRGKVLNILDGKNGTSN